MGGGAAGLGTNLVVLLLPTSMLPLGPTRRLIFWLVPAPSKLPTRAVAAKQPPQIPPQRAGQRRPRIRLVGRPRVTGCALLGLRCGCCGRSTTAQETKEAPIVLAAVATR